MIIRSRRVVLPDDVRPATIHIDDGRITEIGPYDTPAWSALPAAARYDAGDLVVSPGIVDTHVHVNEPGRTDWEGFDTATRAAAAGGVTTIVDMPLNSVPATTTAAALEAKRTSARGKCHVDVAFWGGVVPGNASHLEPLLDAGVRGFKCFLVPSGVDEFPAVDERDLREAVPIIARRGVPLLVHAESPALIRGGHTGPPLRSDAVGADLRVGPSDPRGVDPPVGPASYRAFLETRPPEAEVEAIRLMGRFARECSARIHIVHVASEEAAEEIARAKAEGVSITAETCPHYLTFTAEEVPDGATAFKCAPPIREARHRVALWDALARGTLDLVATDHSPAPPALKCPGDFMKAWGGIASLELSLAAVCSVLVTRGRSAGRLGPRGGAESPALRTIARLMSEAPARLAGLADRKGRIAVRYDADLMVWDPDAEWTVDASQLQQRHNLTPYDGRRMWGRVRTTFVRGARVWDEGRIASPAAGRLL